MTKKMFAAVACLGAVIGFATSPAVAQTMTTVRVNLPYASKVGNVSLPAGEYSIRELNGSVLEFTSQAHRGVNAFVTAMPVAAPNGEASNTTKIVLRHDDKGYQVQTIWLEGQELGFELSE